MGLREGGFLNVVVSKKGGKNLSYFFPVRITCLTRGAFLFFFFYQLHFFFSCALSAFL